MSTRPEAMNERAGEDQQKFDRPTDRPTFFHIFSNYIVHRMNVVQLQLRVQRNTTAE
jgi:hypothetical protein